MNVISEKKELQYKIAILGNPSSFPEWTEVELQALVDIGFNAIQINVAWLSRPNDEALNLRDVVTAPGENEAPRVAERRAKLLERNSLAKKMGMRTIFHFGSPFMWRDPYTGEIHQNIEDRNNHSHFFTDDPWYDTLNPLVVEYEVKLLRELREKFPELDDILIYTYDQDTWKTKEFGNSKFSRGIPLHKRLPDYMKTLHQVWTEGRENEAMLWWETWELSAGQIFKCIPQLPRKGFGLMLHNNIAEVQMALPVDVWFRNTARMCMQLGIPVVGEGFFGSMTEEIEPLNIPSPRLVDEQFIAITQVPGLVGVKEYYGVLPTKTDFNLDMFRARLVNPTASTNELLDIVTNRFDALQPDIRKLLELLSEAIQFFPWDASWFARLTGMASIDHGWSGATIRGRVCETPSWESTRRAHMMMTDDSQPHPFLLEDVQLRCEMAVECMEAAIRICKTLQVKLLNQEDLLVFNQIEIDVDKLKRVTRSYALHLRETNVVEMLRGDIEAGRPLMRSLLDEMEVLLESDAENQYYQGRVMEMQRMFRETPEAFIRTQLVLTENTIYEKGYHTLTTR